MLKYVLRPESEWGKLTATGYTPNYENAGSPESRERGARGREVFESEAGATDRVAQALLELLKNRSSSPVREPRAHVEARS